MDNMDGAELYARVLTVDYALPERIKGGEQGWAAQPIWADADTRFERQQQEEECSVFRLRIRLRWRQPRSCIERKWPRSEKGKKKKRRRPMLTQWRGPKLRFRNSKHSMGNSIQCQTIFQFLLPLLFIATMVNSLCWNKGLQFVSIHVGMKVKPAILYCLCYCVVYNLLHYQVVLLLTMAQFGSGCHRGHHLCCFRAHPCTPNDKFYLIRRICYWRQLLISNFCVINMFSRV